MAVTFGYNNWVVTIRIHIWFILLSGLLTFAAPSFADEVSNPEVTPSVTQSTEDSDTNSATEPATSTPSIPSIPSIPTTDTATQVPAATDTASPEEPSFVDESQRVISEKILNMSKSIDAYFSNDRMMEETTGTYGCLRTSVFYKQGGEVNFSGNVCLKVDLPNTKRRWKLFIESRDEQDQDVDIETGQGPITTTTPEETNSFAGFRYVAEEELLKYISFDVGIKTRIPLDPFTRLRFRRTWVPEPWLYRLTESLYYYNSIKEGFLSRLDIERQLTKTWFSRFTSEADYREEESQFLLKQTFGIYRRLGKGKALNFELMIRGATQPNAQVQYFVYRLRYRANVLRDWFFVEVAPQMLYESDTNFENVAGILFSAEAVFGNF